jgi:hypothetical protein
VSMNIITLKIQEKDSGRWLSILLLLPTKDKLRDIALTALAISVAIMAILLLVQRAPQWVEPLLGLFK